MEAARTATPRHMYQQLPLLPSGPGGVHCLTLRGDRPGHPKSPALEGLRIVAKSPGRGKVSLALIPQDVHPRRPAANKFCP